MSAENRWENGFWAGVLAMFAGAIVAALVFLRLRPKPEPAHSVAVLPQPGAPPASAPREIGFHSHQAQGAPPAKESAGK